LIVTILSTLLFVAAILLLIAVVAVVGAVVILGLAWGLSLVFPVGIMEASVVLMFVAGAFVFFIVMNGIGEALRQRPTLFPPLLDEDWLEDEEDWEEEEEPAPPPPVWRKPPIKLPSMPSRTSPSPAKPKVGRNDPCPCGSGKKYKYCCGR